MDKFQETIGDVEEIKHLVSLIKHLPGLHNQATHGNRYGTGGKKPGGSGKKPASSKPASTHTSSGSTSSSTSTGKPSSSGTSTTGGSASSGTSTSKPTTENKPIHKPVPPPPPKEPPFDTSFDNLSPDAKFLKIENQSSAWVKGLTAKELDAVKSYTGSGYGMINNALRKKTPITDPWLKETIKNLDTALAKGSAPFDMTVKRGTSFGGMDYNKKVKAFEDNIGKVYSDKGYVSTSVADKGFGGNIQFVIHVPKGSKGAYVDKVSSIPGEKEFLLPHDTQFKVLKVTKGSGWMPSTTVEVEVVKNQYHYKKSKEEKHYPGDHNQQDHGHRSGGDSLSGMSSDEKLNTMSKQYEGWVTSLTPQETAGVQSYTGNNYSILNNGLRKPNEYNLSENYKEEIKNIDSALEKGSAPIAFSVTRGMDFSVSTVKEYIKGMNDHVGKVFTDPAYVSTSVNEKGFAGKVQMTIHIPKGSKGAYVADISNVHGEGEFLLPRNTQFKVDKVTIENYGFKAHIELTVVGHKAKSLLFSEEKHYPGDHNQEDHGNRHGESSSGGSSSSSSPKLESTGWFDNLTASQKKTELFNAYKNWEKKLSEDQVTAIETYTGSAYSSMNYSLRNNYDDPHYGPIIQDAKAALNKGSLPFPIFVSRGLSFEEPDEKNAYLDMLEQNIGKSFSDPAFASTSILKNSDFTGYSEDYINIKIHVPRGSKGAYVENITANPGEHEFLLPPGTKFHVISVNRSDSSASTVELAVVKGGKKKEEEVVIEEKHLPGRHDQRTHGNRSGGSEGGNRRGGTIEDEKDTLLRGLYENWSKNITPEEKSAIHDYTSNDYAEINAILRNNLEGQKIPKGKREAYLETANLAWTGLQKGSLPVPITVNRGIGMSVKDANTFMEEMKSNIGKSFVDHAFVSTTTSEDNFFGEDYKGQIKMIIHLPKGTKGAYVASVSEYPGENEFLLPPKTEFKVLKAYTDSGGIHRVELSAMGSTPSGKSVLDSFTTKHYPGRHNQGTHGNRYGRASADTLAGMSDYEKDATMRKAYEGWANKIYSTEKQAIKTYTGMSFQEINGILRNSPEYQHLTGDQRESYQETADNAWTGLFKGSLPFHITVNRGMGMEADKAAAFMDQMKKNLGKTFIDPAFTSTTVNEKNDFGAYSNSQIRMKIHLPKGSKGAYVASMSEYGSENEFLLPPRTSFKVMKAYTDENGINQVELAVQRSGKPRRYGSYRKKEIEFEWRKHQFYDHFIALPVKHYPGAHNQANHGNRYGKPGTSSYESLGNYGRDTYMKNAYKTWEEGLNAEEKSAITTYTGGSYKLINGILRDPSNYSETVKEAQQKTIENVTSALEKGSLSKPITVMRGMGMSVDQADAYMNGMMKNIGKVFSDPAFVSTTTDNDAGFGYFNSAQVKMTIHLPKGAKGGYLENMTQFGGEHEFLMPPKTRFKVLKAYTDEHGTRRVELAMLKPGKTKKKTTNFLSFEKKHYPGMHNQGNHGNRYGRAGGHGAYQAMDDAAKNTVLKGMYQNWIKGLSSDQHDAIEEYTSNAFQDINAILRGKQASNDHYDQLIKDATAGLDNGKLPIPITVNRSMNMSGDNFNTYFDMLQNHIGKVFSDPAFVSTTSKALPGGDYKSYVRLTVHLPKGMKGGYVEDITNYPGEHEFLLPPNTRFKVLKVSKSYSGTSEIELSAMKPGKARTPKTPKKSVDWSNFYEIKHYPGAHDQGSHGNRYGRAGGTGLSQFAPHPNDSWTEMFNKNEKRDKFLREQYKNWENGLSDEESQAINKYTGSAYKALNNNLREGNDLPDVHKDMVKNLDSALNKGSAPFAFTVKRGLHIWSDEDAFGQALHKNVGKIFSDKAYGSSSTDSAFSGNVQMTIHVPKGAKGAYVANLSGISGEHEFLLPRDTKFRIYKSEKQKDAYGNSIWAVELGMVKPGKARTKKEIDWNNFFEEKHYPGAHNQGSHGNRYGRAGGTGLSQFASHPNDTWEESYNKDKAKDVFLKDAFSTWEKSLTPEELQNVKFYTGTGYDVNSALRGGFDLYGSQKDLVKNLDTALDKGKSPVAFTVIRGINLNYWEKDKFGQELQKNIGKIFSDKGYISTSTDSAFGGNVAMTIHVPKGAKGAYVENITANPGEHEYLIPRDAKFKVYKAQKTGNDWHIELGYLKPGKAKKKDIDWTAFFEQKHYPGRHDQGSHGNRFGRAGNSAYENMSKTQKDFFMRDQYHSWMKSLSAEEYQGIKQYTSNDFAHINHVLRTGSEGSPSMKKTIKDATSGLEKGSLAVPITVNRGMYMEHSTLENYVNQLKKNIGKSFSDPAFVSTSINNDGFFGGSYTGDVNLTIHVPKGAKGGYVEAMTTHPGEQEFLFPPQTRFKVLKVDYKGTGPTHIELAVMKPGKAKKGWVDFFEEKHYPGRHNQANHGNRFGKPDVSPLDLMNDTHKDIVMKDVYKEWIGKLSSEEHDAISEYTGHLFSNINDALRKKEAVYPHIQDIITNATSGLEKGKLPFPLTVTRGMWMSDDKLAAYVDNLKKNIGKTFSDPAFVSTTINENPSLFGGSYTGDINLTIHIPKGTSGGYVESFSKNPGENEFLLPPQIKFKVLKVHTTAKGGTQVELAVLKPGKSKKKESGWTAFFEQKHYPGAHDQGTHGNRFGRASADHLAGKSLMEKDKIMGEAYRDWHEQHMTLDENEALFKYTANYYKQMNYALRHPAPSTNSYGKSIETLIDNATSGLNKGNLPFPITTTRGMGFNTKEEGEAFFNEMLANKGKVFSDKAFVSSTLEESSDFGFMKAARFQMRIHFPKGAKGGYVENISANKSEFEFLSPPETRFKVLKAEKGSDGHYFVELSMLKPGKTKKKEPDWSNFYEIKHYPGAHDQGTHGNRYGRAGHNTLSQFEAKPGDDYAVEFQKEADRNEFMTKAYDGWKQTLNGAEKISIKHYTGSGYQDINPVLREGHIPDSTMKEAISYIDSALGKGSAPFAFTVKRGISLDSSNIDSFINQMKKNIGKNFLDAGYVSTSVRTGFHGNVGFTIHVPKGAKGGYISTLSSYPSEHEFLIPRNAKFKVYNVKKNEYGSWEVELGFVKQGKAKKENLDLINFLEVKHYPGAHNQNNHGNRYGRAGADVFKNVSDADKRDILIEKAQPWLDHLSPHEISALSNYTSDNYKEMNEALRTDTVDLSTHASDIYAATDALEKGFAPYNMTVNRKMSFKSDDKDKLDAYIHQLEKAKGKIFTDSAFISTSVSTPSALSGQYEGSVRVTIHVPKNSKGGYVEGISYYSNEAEYLLPPKSRFKVMNVTKTAGGGYHVELSLQKPGGRGKPPKPKKW